MFDREYAMGDWSIAEFCDRIEELEEALKRAIHTIKIGAEYADEYPDTMQAILEEADDLARILGENI